MQWAHPAPTTRMQPRDETAQQQALRRAVELIQAHGGTVAMPESVNIEGEAK